MAHLDQSRQILSTIFAILCTLAVTSSASAQLITWSPTNGPYGGDNLSRIVVGRGGVVYAAGNDRVYVSTNGGESWRKCSPFPTASFYVFGMAIDSSGNLLVGTGGSVILPGLYRTTDMGETWRELDHPTDNAMSIAVAPDGAIYAGGTSNTIFRSDDDGLTWKPTAIYANYYGGISVLPNGSVIASGGGSGGSIAGVVRSNDEGATATLATGPASTDKPIDFAIGTADTIFMVTAFSSSYGDLWRSIDGGASYERLPLLANEPVKACVAVDRKGAVFCGTFGKGLYRSFDGGMNWERLGSLLADTAVVSIDIAEDGAIYAGTLSGPWRSRDGGETWVPVFNGLHESIVTVLGISGRGELYVATKEGPMVSTDKGNSWRHLPPRSTNRPIISGAVSSDNSLYVGDVAGGVHRYDPATDRWSVADIRLDSTVSAIAFVEDEDHISQSIVAGTTRGTIYRSDDLGREWRVIRRDTTPNGYIAGLASTPDGTLFAAAGNAFHRWRESSGWETIRMPARYQFFSRIASNGSYVALLGRDTGWLSSDMGESWKPLPSTMDSKAPGYSYYHAVAVTSDGWVVVSCGAYAATGGTVFRTELLLPGENEWWRVDDGLDRTRHIGSFALHPDRTLFGGTWGLYRTDGPLSPVRRERQVSHDLSLQIDPMPLATHGVATIAVEAAGRYTLSLYDMSGRRLATVFDGELEKGTRSISLATDELPTGAFVIELRGGGSSRRRVVIVAR